MSKVNVAVIGCGSWGKNQVRVFNDLQEASLVAIADLNENAARNLGEKYSVEWYTDIEKVIDRPDIEAITICTPTVTHAEIALQAIKSGKHVLVEKPMTNTIEEAEALIKAAEKKSVSLAVGFIERFNPAVREGMKIISKEEIGDVILANTRRVSRRPHRIGDVGVIKDLAIHDIDIINNLFKENPRSVFATAGNITHRYEDYANIMICYDDNKSAFIESNWLTPQRVRRLIITGTKGLINIEYTSQEISVQNNERIYQPFIENREPLQLELGSFVNSILRNEPPKITGIDGLKALQICEAALRSAKTGATITL
jgi:UDP-N-acetylglucosamine 3-dehydrogenase